VAIVLVTLLLSFTADHFSRNSALGCWSGQGYHTRFLILQAQCWGHRPNCRAGGFVPGGLNFQNARSCGGLLFAEELVH
jgi:hypothetical protein